MEEQAALTLHEVSKHYAGKTAVEHASFSVPAGVVFGLLGPNGAGKTSLIRMITRITLPDSGSIRFLGEPLREAHQHRMGYMPEERGLYRKMKVQEQLHYLLRLRNQDRKQAVESAREWLERLGMSDVADKKVEELSKGMQQKIQFISTIAHRPPLLILDEPFSGLDPLNADLMENILYELRDQGTSILLSTHRMEQVEQLCTHIALINNSRIVLVDEVENAKQAYKQNIFSLWSEAENPLSHQELPVGVKLLDQQPGYRQFQVQEPEQAQQMLAKALERGGVNRFQEDLPSLRDIFIRTVHSSNTAGATPTDAPTSTPANSPNA